MRNKAIPAALVTLAFAAAVSVMPAVAVAGTVDITSCGDAPAGGVDNAWTYRSDDTTGYEQAPTGCPPDGSQFGGLTAWTTLQSGVAVAAPAGAQLRFVAPTDTTISHVRIRRDIGTSDDGYYVFGRTDSGQLTGETCTIPIGQFTCDVGGPATAEAVFPALSATWVAWGFQCGANGFVTCGTGATLHQAWATIYSSTVTLTDNQSPSVPTVAGPVTRAGWKRATVGAAATSDDNLGIRAIRWYADGLPVSGSSTTRTCDFSTPVPCSNLTGTAASLDTTALDDGTRSVQLAAVDPAGNETRSAAFDVQIDNTPPAAPTGLAVSGGGSSPSFSLAWTNPAAGGSPLAGASWQACPRGGGPCIGGTGTVGGSVGSAFGTLPSGGTYGLSVWLVDEAGNAAQANSATGTVTFTASPSSSGGGSSGGAGGGTGTSADGSSGTANGTGGDPTPPGSGAVSPPPRTASPPTRPPSSTPRAPTAPAARPGIEISSASISARTERLAVRGSISRRATGTVTVTYRATIAGAVRMRTARAPIRRGRYTSALKLPRGWRDARGATVTVRFAGSGTVQAGSTTLRMNARR